MLMSVVIKNTNEKEVKKFNEKEWHRADIEHYGRPVKWVSKLLVFKAVEKGKVVGSIKARYEVGVVFVKNIIVAKDKRRQGIGKKLIEQVEKTGKRLGAHKLYLNTMEKWNSTPFYKSLGFKKTADLKKHYLKKDFVIYTKLIK